MLLAACSGARLEDFASSELSLEVARDGRVVARLSGATGSCPFLISDVRASLNGVALAWASRGGERATTEGWTCEAPSFSVPGGALVGPDAEITLSDGTATIALTARNVFVERRLVPKRVEESADGARRWAFRWEPETDGERSATWKLEDGGAARFGEAALDEDGVSLALPEDGPATGTLRVDGQGLAPITRCEGVARCVARVAISSGEIVLSGERP